MRNCQLSWLESSLRCAPGCWAEPRCRATEGSVGRTPNSRPPWWAGFISKLYKDVGGAAGQGESGWPLGDPMRRIFWSGRRDPRPGPSSTSPWAACLGFGCVGGQSQAVPRYLTGYCAVGQLHRAASVGAVATVERFLTFRVNGINDPDKRNR